MLRPIPVTDKMRNVGDRLAIVIAETAKQARLAAEAVIVDYEPLPVVSGAPAAMAEDAPAIWKDSETGNLSVANPMGDADATQAVFDAAEVTIKHRLVTPRIPRYR